MSALASGTRDSSRTWRAFGRSPGPGLTAEAGCGTCDRSRERDGHPADAIRARRLLGTKLEYIAHPSFDDPDARDAILGPMPGPAAGESMRPTKAPQGVPPYIASLHEVPLLTREQEAHLFRKMNYLKYRASKIGESLDPARAEAADLDAIERLQKEALDVMNQIISANLRLVVSIAKKHVRPYDNFFERVSDGNMSLIRAVEKFDFSRGFKFSTYASWSIIKNFTRNIPKEKIRRDRFITGHEALFEAAANHRSDEHECESDYRRDQDTVHEMLGKLNDRERRVLVSRFGIGSGCEQTLEQIGKELGITKERVRQIEARAQDKLRKYAGEVKFEPSLA